MARSESTVATYANVGQKRRDLHRSSWILGIPNRILSKLERPCNIDFTVQCPSRVTIRAMDLNLPGSLVIFAGGATWQLRENR